MIFSLIVATCGRVKEIDTLFESLSKQSIGPESFEVILVDQNESESLSWIVETHSINLRINHIRSTRKGLSYNRNIGLSAARGDYVCFPDDDCTYYPDTLAMAYKHLKEGTASAVFGAIRDRATGESIIRNWPSSEKKINRYNFYHLFSSITIFAKKSSIRFNENLGAGCYFGSNEDADYTYSLIKKMGNCNYHPDIELWHPKAGVAQFSKEKNRSYGLGFGAFCAAYKFDLFIARLFFLALGYHVSLAALAILRGDLETAEKRWDAFLSRINGFIEYPTK